LALVGHPFTKGHYDAITQLANLSEVRAKG
jgi:hypothetical protein